MTTSIAAILTGSTGSIGREIAIGLVQSGITDLILPYRDKEKADSLEAALKKMNKSCNLHFEYLDFNSVSSVKTWANNIARKFPSKYFIVIQL
jgi:short-subunit dehydrogenase